MAIVMITLTKQYEHYEPNNENHLMFRQVLQQHCDFFDLNRDGVVSPLETFIGFRLLQWGIFLSLLATFIIHSSFSWFSLAPGRWIPDPLFRIYLANIHGAKHGSDTGTYDHEGRFRAQEFADFFAKFGEKLEDGSYGITYIQALHGARRQWCVFDLFGFLAELFECAYSQFCGVLLSLNCLITGTATWLTIWPADGIMRMEDVRAVYDGSYFYKTAGHRREMFLRKSVLY